ncbi:substrate-binding domain-containing protein [Salinirubellus sp. GCM10025818]|uniref:substrate-binding domain-containing protein n=1 Tax=Salinirubellus TaxID=2162630 RepID=UPI0030D4C54A
MTNEERPTRKDSRRTFLKAAGLTGTVGLTGLAGCLGGGDGGDGGDGGVEVGDGGGGDGDSTPTPTETSSGDGGSTETDAGTDSGEARDFGGETLNVMLNVGSISTVHQQELIPRVEEKYNLNINTETAVTTQQLTQIQANPDNPPDVIIPDVIGIERASRNEWLEPMSDHEDIVTNLGDIYDKFVHYDSTGVSWEIGEVLPVVNTNMWDEPPTSYEQVMTESESTSLVPFSWSGGPYLLLMASAIATGEDFSSSDLDVEAGFQYLEENLKPNVSNSYQGVASAKQQLASGNVDTLNVFWDYMVFDMFQNDAPITPVFRPDPVGIAFAESVAVPRNTDKMEAAMTYANECLSVEFQEAASAAMGCGVTNQNATVADQALEFGAATPDTFEDLAFPDFQYIWDNRDDWSQRWNEIFSG